jgi:hypothetical protein
MVSSRRLLYLKMQSKWPNKTKFYSSSLGKRSMANLIADFSLVSSPESNWMQRISNLLFAKRTNLSRSRGYHIPWKIFQLNFLICVDFKRPIHKSHFWLLNDVFLFFSVSLTIVPQTLKAVLSSHVIHLLGAFRLFNLCGYDPSASFIIIKFSLFQSQTVSLLFYETTFDAHHLKL